MNKEVEYYLGYLRNPKQVKDNAFQDVKELKVVVEYNGQEYREVSTRRKIFIEQPNEVFYGHQVFQSGSGFIGRIGVKLTKDEALNKLKELKDTKEDYLNQLTTIMNDTFELAIIREKSYINTVSEFANFFRK